MFAKAGPQLMQHLSYQENSAQTCTKGEKATTEALKNEGYIYFKLLYNLYQVELLLVGRPLFYFANLAE